MSLNSPHDDHEKEPVLGIKPSQAFEKGLVYYNPEIGFRPIRGYRFEKNGDQWIVLALDKDGDLQKPTRAPDPIPPDLSKVGKKLTLKEAFLAGLITLNSIDDSFNRVFGPVTGYEFLSKEASKEDNWGVRVTKNTVRLELPARTAVSTPPAPTPPPASPAPSASLSPPRSPGTPPPLPPAGPSAPPASDSSAANRSAATSSAEVVPVATTAPGAKKAPITGKAGLKQMGLVILGKLLGRNFITADTPPSAPGPRRKLIAGHTAQVSFDPVKIKHYLLRCWEATDPKPFLTQNSSPEEYYGYVCRLILDNPNFQIEDLSRDLGLHVEFAAGVNPVPTTVTRDELITILIFAMQDYHQLALAEAGRVPPPDTAASTNVTPLPQVKTFRKKIGSFLNGILEDLSVISIAEGNYFPETKQKTSTTASVAEVSSTSSAPEKAKVTASEKHAHRNHVTVMNLQSPAAQTLTYAAQQNLRDLMGRGSAMTFTFNAIGLGPAVKNVEPKSAVVPHPATPAEHAKEEAKALTENEKKTDAKAEKKAEAERH